MQMRGQPSYVAALRNAGFGMLCVANNHSMQHGGAAFLDTVEMLRGAGIGVCGLAGSSFRTALPEVVVKNGLTVAFLGWSLRPRQYFVAGPLYAEGYREDMLRDVRSARKIHDCVVVSLHWGDEFIEEPSREEIDLAHNIMDAGADLIIGHHPHVLRGSERRGRGWIVYSLGNFLSDMVWSGRLRESAIVQCRLTPDGVEGLTFLPVRVADDYRPILLDGEHAEILGRRLAALSEDIARVSAEPVSEEGSARYPSGGRPCTCGRAEEVSPVFPETGTARAGWHPRPAVVDLRQESHLGTAVSRRPDFAVGASRRDDPTTWSALTISSLHLQQRQRPPRAGQRIRDSEERSVTGVVVASLAGVATFWTGFRPRSAPSAPRLGIDGPVALVAIPLIGGRKAFERRSARGTRGRLRRRVGGFEPADVGVTGGVDVAY